MAIDMKTETLRGMAEAARRLPSSRPGKRLCPATVTRWVTSGVLVDERRRVRLEAVKVGGAWVTSDEAIERFIAATTPPMGEAGEAAQTPPRTPGARQRASQRAADELRSAGI